MTIEYSVVVPLKNEEENLLDLIAEIEPVLEELQSPWELICIDDGSTDQTLSLLQSVKTTKPYLRIISFTKNFGQSSAFDAGFKAAQGTYVITLDGDRQNDPRDIPKLLALMENADLACGIRKKRKDPLSKRWISKVANWVRSRFCKDGVQDTGCSLKVYRRESLSKIKMYQGMHRFLPALFSIEGMKIAETPVNHRERAKGKTKYTFFNRSFNTVADMFAVRWMRNRRLQYQIEHPPISSNGN